MTDQKKIDLPLETEEKKSDGIDEKDFRIGYFVGIDNNSGIVFRVMGSQQTVQGLTSVHAYAGSQIQEAKMNNEQEAQVRLQRMIQMLNGSVQAVSGAVNFLDTKVDELTNKFNRLADPKVCDAELAEEAELVEGSEQ